MQKIAKAGRPCNVPLVSPAPLAEGIVTRLEVYRIYPSPGGAEVSIMVMADDPLNLCLQ
jgi:hypothetical protein